MFCYSPFSLLTQLPQHMYLQALMHNQSSTLLVGSHFPLTMLALISCAVLLIYIFDTRDWDGHSWSVDWITVDHTVWNLLRLAPIIVTTTLKLFNVIYLSTAIIPYRNSIINERWLPSALAWGFEWGIYSRNLRTPTQYMQYLSKSCITSPQIC